MLERRRLSASLQEGRGKQAAKRIPGQGKKGSDLDNDDDDDDDDGDNEDGE
jgi:hypothetical protein